MHRARRWHDESRAGGSVTRLNEDDAIKVQYVGDRDDVFKVKGAAQYRTAAHRKLRKKFLN